MTQTKSASKKSRTGKELPPEWFAGDAVALAPRLLGKIIRRGTCAGIIVETEAYTTDAASHAAHITARSAQMRDTYGHWYIHFTYGMHHCANITTNKDAVGAVLLRAVEPIEGLPLMKRQRARSLGKSDISKQNLCSGPAKFCQAFGISLQENTAPVAGNFAIYDAPDIPKGAVGTSGRIGIKKDADLPWRFYIKDNPFVSR